MKYLFEKDRVEPIRQVKPSYFKYSLYTTMDFDENDTDTILSLAKPYIWQNFKTILEVPTQDLHFVDTKAFRNATKIVFKELPNPLEDVFTDIFIHINPKSCMRYNKSYSIYDIPDIYVEHLHWCFMFTDKGKLLGRAFISKNTDFPIFFNIYQQMYREMFIYTEVGKAFRDFYINEFAIIPTTKATWSEVDEWLYNTFGIYYEVDAEEWYCEADEENAEEGVDY